MGEAKMKKDAASDSVKPGPHRPYVLLGVVALATVGLIVLLIGALRGSGDQNTTTTGGASGQAEGGRAGGARGTAPGLHGRGRAGAGTLEGSRSIPEHHIPASEVSPPPPDLDRNPPPPPKDTRNPADYDLPKHNPGGVNGDRPPRPVPGLD